MTLAQRNNNPGNIKGDTRWKGCIGLDERGHCKFKDVPSGLRAMIRTLAQKMGPGQKPNLLLLIGGRESHGFNDGWSQASDTIGSIPGAPQNDPQQYARTVAGWLGVAPYERLDIFDERGDVKHVTKLTRLISAMTRYEAGKNWLYLPDILDGISDYIRDFVDVEKEKIA